MNGVVEESGRCWRFRYKDPAKRKKSALYGEWADRRIFGREVDAKLAANAQIGKWDYKTRTRRSREEVAKLRDELYEFIECVVIPLEQYERFVP